MRPLGVGFGSKRGRERPGIADALEDLHRRELVTLSPVEGLRVTDLPSAPRLYVQSANTQLFPAVGSRNRRNSVFFKPL